MNLDLHTEIINHSHPSYLCTIANTALKPLRSLFDGTTIEILNDHIVRQESSFYEETDYLTTAIAIATLIPGYIVGVLFRALAVYFDRYAEDRALVNQFYQRPAPLPISPSGVTLAEFSQSFNTKREAVLDRIDTDKAIWQDPTFIQDISLVMEEGYKYMDVYFRQIREEGGHAVNEIKDLMLLQSRGRESGSTDQNYAFIFFAFSTFYHLARCCVTRLHESERQGRCRYIPLEQKMPLRPQNTLTNRDEEPYFNPTKPQYRWRELYNAFCTKIDDINGLRSLLEQSGSGRRYSNWSHPDLQKNPLFYYPDTIPT